MTLSPCSVCSQPAAWACSKCGPKCVEHVRRKKGAQLRYKCTECSEPAELLRAPRAELYAFKDRFRKALTTGLLGRPLVLMLACGLLFSLSAFVDLLGSVLGVTATVIAGLAILRAAANDEPFDWFRLSDPVEELAIPAGKGLLALSPVIVAVIAFITVPIVQPYDSAMTHEHSLSVTLALSPLFWGVSLASVIYAPFALLNAGTAQTWGDVFNFRAALALVKRRVKDIPRVFAVAGVGLLVTLIFSMVLPKDWLAMVLIGTLAGATGIATMRVLAEFIYLEPDAFGWGQADEALEDLAAPTAPAYEEGTVSTPPLSLARSTLLEGQLRAAAASSPPSPVVSKTPEAQSKAAPVTSPPTPPASTPPTGQTKAAAVAAPPAPPAPEALSPEAQAWAAALLAPQSQTMPMTLERQMKAALDAKDAKLAHQLFTRTPGAEKQLTPATLTRLGQASAFLGEYTVAITALLEASNDPSVEAVNPLMIAAKIMDETLRDLVSAKMLYEQVIRRFPGTQGAVYAQQQLSDPRFFAVAKAG